VIVTSALPDHAHNGAKRIEYHGCEKNTAKYKHQLMHRCTFSRVASPSGRETIHTQEITEPSENHGHDLGPSPPFNLDTKSIGVYQCKYGKSSRRRAAHLVAYRAFLRRRKSEQPFLAVRAKSDAATARALEELGSSEDSEHEQSGKERSVHPGSE